MKKIVLFSFVAAFIANLSAQNAVSEMFEIDKQEVPGYTITFTGKNEDLVRDAFKSYLEKINGLKAGKSASKGFSGYQKQILMPLSPTATLDIYFKVVDEGKRNAKATRLYFAFKTFATAGEVAAIESNSIMFLNDFVPYLVNFEHLENLKTAQSRLEKLIKESEDLKEDKTDLEEDIIKLQDKVKVKEREIVDKDGEIRKVQEEVLRLKNLLGQ